MEIRGEKVQKSDDLLKEDKRKIPIPLRSTFVRTMVMRIFFISFLGIDKSPSSILCHA